MTDLKLVTDLRPAAPLLSPDELGPARRRLTAAIAAEQIAVPVPALIPDRAAAPGLTDRLVRRRLARPRLTGHGRRGVVAGAALAAVAAGSAAALIVGLTAGSGPRPAAHAAPATAYLTAAQFLDAAARHVATEPSAPPRPDQYVYSELRGTGRDPQLDVEQGWVSADGTRVGLTDGPPGWDAVGRCPLAPAEAGRCDPAMGYQPGLPIRPSAVLAYLIRLRYIDAAQVSGPHAVSPALLTDDVAKTIVGILNGTYLRPAQRAAVYRFLGTLPGMTLVRHAVDPIGRPGIAVAWRFEGFETQIIFDPRSYSYLGIDEGTPSASGRYGGWVLVKFGFVNTLPRHPRYGLPGKGGHSGSASELWSYARHDGSIFTQLRKAKHGG